MFEQTYDIIDWKSCETYSLQDSSTDDKKNIFGIRGVYPLSRDDIASTTDIIFPKLFHEQESETSIVSIPDEELDFGPLHFHTGLNSEQTVYQKVANWVLTQRNYFRNVDVCLEDDEIEVIDPVDLFHESSLNDYLLITEDESERRILLRDFASHRYHIQSAAEAMKTNEYRFLRKPKGGIELELKRIVDLHKFHKSINPKHLRKRTESSSTLSLISQSSAPSDVEETEEQLQFLGVPRLLDSYIILNREGYVIKEDKKTDLWLSPLEVGLVPEVQQRPTDNGELDFMSSWFSDVYQTDLNTDEVRTLVTVNTDLMEKATVISVSNPSEEEVWVDAPNIPHWFDDEQEELELFNQPSRPLYYYRDRIKGCYRIIGVEDETVVLFSGNDDDTIFYPGDEIPNDTSGYSPSSGWPDGYRGLNDAIRFRRSDSDRKTDSGIEDIDDMISEEVAIASIEISKDARLDCFPEKTAQLQKLHFSKQSVVEVLFVLVALVTLAVAVFLPTSNSIKLFQTPKYTGPKTNHVLGKILERLKNR